MKIRTQKADPPKENAIIKTAIHRDPTTDEIRGRAHQILMARGGSPGNQLEDWLRAEQQLKQERSH